MAAPTFVNRTGQASGYSTGLGKIAWPAAILAALSGILYSVSFIFIKDNLWNGLFLLVSGLLGGDWSFSFLRGNKSGRARVGPCNPYSGNVRGRWGCYSRGLRPGFRN